MYKINSKINKFIRNLHKFTKSSWEKTLLYSTRGSIDVGLLGENYHKISLIVGEDLHLNEGVVPLSWGPSYIALLSK